MYRMKEKKTKESVSKRQNKITTEKEMNEKKKPHTHTQITNLTKKKENDNLRNFRIFQSLTHWALH